MDRYTPPSSSLGKSIASGMPAYAAPVCPQTHYIQGSPAWAQNLNVPSEAPSDGAGVVVRKNRSKGMRFLYQRGAHTTPWFHMRATGQVESSRFQPTSAATWFDAFNDALHEAGYPRNLGLSEKVATIPPEALGTSPSQMAPVPRRTRSIFTRRNYSTAPAVPAKPQES